MAKFSDLPLRNENTCETKPISPVPLNNQTRRKHSSIKRNNLENIVKKLHLKKVKSIGSGKDKEESQNLKQESLKLSDASETHQKDSKTSDKCTTLEKKIDNLVLEKEKSTGSDKIQEESKNSIETKSISPVPLNDQRKRKRSSDKCNNLENIVTNLQFKKVKSIESGKDEEVSQNLKQQSLKFNDVSETHPDSETSDKHNTLETKFDNLVFEKEKSTGGDKNQKRSTNSIKTNLNDQCHSHKKDYKSCDKGEKTFTKIVNSTVSVLYSRTKEYEVIFNEFMQYQRRQLTNVKVLNVEDQIALREKVSKYDSAFESFKEIQFRMGKFIKQDHESKSQKDENFFSTFRAKYDKLDDLYSRLMSDILQI